MRKKNVFITGCNSSLGKKLVKAFLKKNFNVIGTFNKNKKELTNISNFKSFKLNLEKNEDFENVLKKLKKRKIIIDVLINNAAIPYGSLTEMTRINDLKKIFNINFFAQIKLIQYLLRFIKKSDNGIIINIGSISGHIPIWGNLAYGSSKCALMFATKIMALEFKKYNIKVFTVAPSIFKSKMSNLIHKNIRKTLLKTSNDKEVNINKITKLIIQMSTKKKFKQNLKNINIIK